MTYFRATLQIAITAGGFQVDLAPTHTVTR